MASSKTAADRQANQERNTKLLTEIGGNAALELQRELDLTVSARPVFSNAAASNRAALESWAQAIQLRDRFPEVLGAGLVRFVDKPGGASCFTVAAITLEQGLPGLPTGKDICAIGLTAAVLEARDSGKSSVMASALLFGQAQMMIQAPIYDGGSVPSTTHERRMAFIGNFAIVVRPADILAAARRNYPDVPVVLTYRDSTGVSYSFPSGADTRRDLALTRDVGNGWSISTGPNGSSSLSAGATLLLIVGIGSLISMLVGLLVYTLVTGRLRALRTAEQRTTELRRMALHDSLTDLPNRTLLLDQIDELMVSCAHRQTIPALLYVDLDGFKTVNDTLGHVCGDQLLLAVSERLCGVVRKPDIVGRMGGDEFVALIEISVVEDAEAIAFRILAAMRKPINLDVDGASRPVYVTASVGIATGERPTNSELLRDADLALYRAKAHGSDSYQTFRPEMQETARELLEMEAELHDACERRQFELHYQPTYDLADLSLVGVEALLRWNHPVIGTVSPERFVPLLEHNGQIIDVGRWVLLEACQQVATWRHQGHQLTLSVNVSGRQLDREAIVTDIQAALDSSGLDAGALTIEITETSLVRDAAATAERLAAIRRIGVHVAIDDFGTGYCSLAYLQQFAVDGIKIDRAFTHAIGTTTEATALMRTLVQLANDLGVYTLAEGVETLEQLDQLRSLGVDYAQGFLLARPLPVAKLQDHILSPHLAIGANRSESTNRRFKG